MNVVGIGLIEMLMLIGLGGGAGLPLGVPPAPEDPTLARIAPEQCLYYTSWAGMAEPDPASENQTEQLLAEPEVRHLLNEIGRLIETGVRRQVGREGPQAEKLADDAIGWAKTLLTHPAAFFVAEAKFSPQGPEVQAGAIVRVGDQADKLKAQLEQYQTMFLPEAAEKIEIDGDSWYRIQLDPQTPPITWGVKKSYLIVGVGEGAVEGILKRARTRPPEWFTELRDRLPVERVSSVARLNVQAILETAGPMAGPMLPAILEATGLDNVTSLASVTGLDKEGFVNRTLLEIDGEPRGMLAQLTAKPLGPKDLGPIPADATIALAARIDTAAILEAFTSTLQSIEPRAANQFNAGIDAMEGAMGFDLRKDVLGSLGDTWCVYNSPSEGGLLITGLTAVVPVKDRDALAEVLATFQGMVAAESSRGGSRRRGPRIEQFEFAGQKVHFFNARDDDFFVAPAWCLTEKELIVAAFPQNVKAYLSRDPSVKSLATAPEVAELFASGNPPVMLSYADTGEIFRLLYPFAPMLAQVASEEFSREGVELNASILPSAAAISPHLRPTVSAVRRTEAGIEMIARQTLPGGNIGTAAPVAVSLLLPAVQSARGAARRAASMNNLRQIALAMLNHESAFKRFPPAYTADKEGKPLLSWRVHILPFIEQEALYNQFHLDEPWDSEHNKKLIPLMPGEYRSPGGHAEPGKTNYLTVRGKDTAFPGDEKIGLRDIPDGTSRTIMALEVGDAAAVTWTKPDDFKYDEANPTAGLTGLHRGGFNTVFCDGSVRFIALSIDTAILKALFTRNGGEVVNLPAF